MSRMMPLELLFGESSLVRYVCFNCGAKEQVHCANDKKFKLFVKKKVNKDDECLECGHKDNIFRNMYGQQFWINHK